MEALGVAASVAGLISLAVQIPKLIETAVSIRSAPDEAKLLSQTVEALIAALKRLEEFLKTDEAKDLHLTDDSALVLSISACQNRILSLCQKLRSQSQPGLTSIKAAAARFKWPLDKAECLALISEIHAMQSTCEFCLIIKNCQQMAKSHREVAAYFENQKETLKMMGEFCPDQTMQVSVMIERIRLVESCVSDAAQRLNHIQIGIDELRKINNDMAESHEDELYGQALEWLSPFDPSEKHEEVRATRLPGTCEWVLQDTILQEITQPSNSEDHHLVGCWVGDPGQGKTCTMSRIVDHLHESQSSNPKTYTTYLYCDYQSTSSYSTTTLVGSVVRELLAQMNSLPTKVANLVRHAHIKLKRPNARLDEIIQVLGHLKPLIDRLFVCIDGLDECKEGGELIAACKRFPLQTSFIFIGRPSILATVKLNFPSAIEQVLEPQYEDVDAVVTARIEAEKLRQPELMPDTLMEQIRREITSLANGMFLLASLHTMLVLSSDTVYRRREALASLPNTLEGTFGRSIARVREDKSVSRALKILAWIHFLRPLQLFELQHALAVETHHTEFHSDNVPSLKTVLDCCLGLVRVDSRAGSGGNIDTSASVTLVHSTLSVYLDSNPDILQDMIPLLTEICLTYLSFDLNQQIKGKVQSLMSSSWLQLLHESTKPMELLDKAWKYCEKLNASINQEPHESIGLIIEILPEHAQVLAMAYQQGRGRQSIVHTAYMLGLDTFDDLLSRIEATEEESTYISSSPINNGYRPIQNYDSFGVTPLGWVLLPSITINSTQQLRPYQKLLRSYEYRLWRAERALRTVGGREEEQPLWLPQTFNTIRVFFPVLARERINYISNIPFLFFLGNYHVAPEATRVCIAGLNSYTKNDIWTSLRSGGSAPNQRVSSINDEKSLWRLLAMSSDGRDSKKEFSKRIGTMGKMGTEWRAQTRLVGSVGREVAEEQAWKNIIALFEPKSLVPIVVEQSSSQWRCINYCSGQQGVVVENTNCPGTTCTTLFIPKELLLHTAAIGNSVQSVNYALELCKLDPNMRDHKGQTPLHLALLVGASSVADMLINKCENIHMHTRDIEERTLVHACVVSQQPNYLLIILSKHPELVDMRDQHGNTALHYSAESSLRQITNLLLVNNADANIVNENGNTPLHLAILKRDAIICKIILESQFRTKLSTHNLERSWALALESGAGFIITMLQSLRSVSSKLLTPGDEDIDPHRNSALTYSKRNLAVMLVTEQNQNLQETDLAFMIELTRQSESAGCGMQSLIQADPDAVIRNAVIKGAANIAEFLMSRFPIQMNRLGEDGESFLHLTVIYDSRPAFELLLGNDTTDFTVLNARGYSALHLALLHRRVDICAMLLNCPKVRSEQTTSSGATSLHLAVANRVHAAIPVLLENQNLALNKLDEFGRAALHLAVLQQDAEVTRMLLNCPRIIADKKSQDGRTALAYAALCGGEDLVSLLLSTHRFDLNQIDNYGKTALDWARNNTCAKIRSMLEGCS